MKKALLLIGLLLLLSGCSTKTIYVKSDCPTVQDNNCELYFDRYGGFGMDGKFYVRRIGGEEHELTGGNDKFLFCKQLECENNRDLYLNLECNK